MKVCKALILLSLFMVAFYNCAPPPDEDTKEETGEDTTTAELPWTGETDKFTINTKEGVHLNDPEEDAGTAYITFPSSSVHNTRWEFGVRLTFNPSANNYARFYLTSSSNVLSGELTGYFIQIGGAKDNVALYRQNGAELKLLASGRELMKGNNSPKLYVKQQWILDFLDTVAVRGRIYERKTGQRQQYTKFRLLWHILCLHKDSL